MAHLKGHSDKGEIERVYESFSGDYWVVTRVESKSRGFGFARLSQMPQFAEWGSINLRELKTNSQVWRVPEESWSITGPDNEPNPINIVTDE